MSLQVSFPKPVSPTRESSKTNSRNTAGSSRKSEDAFGETPNSELNDQGKPVNWAIADGKQAYSIASKLENDQGPRNRIEAIVDKKYNGDLPFDPTQLRESGESWRHNFTTNFMSGIIGKVIPAPVGLIDTSRYLTSAELCSYDSPDASKKSETFRDKLTRSTKSWNEWRNFQYGLWTEVILHGSAIVAHLDPYSPWPEMYRTDKAWVPIGTGQHASNVPFFAAMKDYLVHEFVEFIKDKQIAEDSGWDTEAAIKAVNDALPKTNTGSAGVPEVRTYEDAVREGNPGASYSGAKVISVYHVLAVEPDTQKVSHYMVNRNGEHEVFFQKNERFDKITDVITLFTLEPGNGTFYGAKGLGRVTLNASIAAEANRNGLFDQLRLAGMTILKTDAVKTPTVQLKVRHPLLIVSADGEIQQQPISPNVESFVQADDQISRWVEQAIGAYISDLHGEDQGPHPTATEENIRAQREKQFQVAFLARAWGQHSEMMSIIQKRLCDPDTTDDIAKALQKELKELEFLPEEIKELSESPTAEVVQDMSDQKNQKIIAAFTAFRGDPDFDQHKLKDMAATAMVNPQFSKDVLLDEQGTQANEIEAFRAAAIENEAMIDGASIPASPRDPHEFHLKKHLGDLQQGLPNIATQPDPKMLDAVNIALRHMEGHIGLWKEGGAPPESTRPFEDAVKAIEKALVAIAQDAQKRTAEGQGGPQSSVSAPQGGIVPPGQQDDSQAPPPMEDHLAKIAASISYDKAPPSIQAQIEAAAGFKPASPEERAAWEGTRAEEKHPASPIQGKVQATRVTQALPVGAPVPLPPPPIDTTQPTA